MFFHADSEDSDHSWRMPRLIGVFAWRTLILLVLSCRGSFQYSINIHGCKNMVNIFIRRTTGHVQYSVQTVLSDRSILNQRPMGHNGSPE